MTTSSFARISDASLVVSIAAFLSRLFKEQEVKRSIQRANAMNLLQKMNQKLIAGQLKVQEVKTARNSNPGRVLVQVPHGQAVLSLLEGATYLQAGDWGMAATVVAPALEDRNTKLMALVIKVIAFEQQGNIATVNESLDALAERSDLIERVFTSLIVVNINRGVQAIAEGDSLSIESSIDRVISLDRMGREFGQTRIVDSAFGITEAWLKGDSDAFATYMHNGISADVGSKKSMQKGIETEISKLSDQTREQFLKYFESFREGVGLLSIEDPFDRWDELGRLVGRDWPKELSPEDAVSEERS